MSGFTPPSSEPSSLTCGALWTWYKTLADYPQSAGWSAIWYLHGSFNLSITAATGPSDTQYQPSVPATTTATLVTGDTPSTIHWDLWVVNGTQKYALETGTFLVRPNLSTPPTAQKSHDELMLDALRLKLQARVTADLSHYTIGQRAAVHEEIMNLQKLIDTYQQRVWRSRTGSAFGGPPVEVSFGGLTAVPLGTWRP